MSDTDRRETRRGNAPGIGVRLAILVSIAALTPVAFVVWIASDQIERDAVARAEALIIVAEMHSGFAEVRRNLPMDFGRALPQPELDENTQKQVARIVEIWESVLTRSGRQGDYLFGPFGIADAFYAPVVSRFETYNITLPEASRAYAQRMLALGPMQEWRVASLEDNA